MSKKLWTEEEVTLLRGLMLNNVNLTYKEIGDKLGRTGATVRGKMKRVGIPNRTTLRGPVSVELLCDGDECDVVFTRQKSNMVEYNYCSRECHTSSNRYKVSLSTRYPKNMLTCTGCGIEFHRPASQAIGKKMFHDLECKKQHGIDSAKPYINKDGYVSLWVGYEYLGAYNGYILEHRKVMQEHLNRPLLSEENVHHKNGDRVNNLIENLELWNTSQPAGQRVEDKLAWAHALIAFYEGEQ